MITKNRQQQGIKPESPSSSYHIGLELPCCEQQLSETEIEKLWTEEAQRRHEELGNGFAKSLPADVALKNARLRLKEL